MFAVSKVLWSDWLLSTTWVFPCLVIYCSAVWASVNLLYFLWEWTHSCCISQDLFVLRILPFPKEYHFVVFYHAICAFGSLLCCTQCCWDSKWYGASGASRVLVIWVSCLVPWLASILTFQVPFCLTFVDAVKPYHYISTMFQWSLEVSCNADWAAAVYHDEIWYLIPIFFVVFFLINKWFTIISMASTFLTCGS